MTERQSAGGEAERPESRVAPAQSNQPPADASHAARRTQSRSNASIDTSRSGLPAGSSAEPPVPKNFGRYTIERELGRGAMGVVYLAEDTQLHRKVALKIPQQASLQAPEALERFYREARTTATLRHNNICAIYDVGAIDGVHFLAMAYIPGKPVSRFVVKDKLPSARQSALLVRKIALALAEAHRQGVVHRDLKPSNVMLDDRGEPIVMDFGLARQMNTVENARLTQSGAILGTPAYMAPEQVRGETDQIGPASDIYALGVMLFQFLTGELPFSGPVMMVFAQIVTQAPPRPSELRPDVDPALESICLKMMAKEIAQRYATMKEVAGALTQYLKAGSAAASGNRSVEASTPPPDELELSRNGLPDVPGVDAEPASQRTMRPKRPPVVSTPGRWSKFRGKPWFLPMVGGLSALIAGLLGSAVYFQSGSTPTGSREDLNAAQSQSATEQTDENAATPPVDDPKAAPAIEPGFPVGAVYRGRWKNFAAGNLVTDAETALTIAVKEREGSTFVSEWKLHNRNAVWIVKGDVVATDHTRWKVTSEDLDLVGGDHPNEQDTSLVAEIESAAGEQPEAIRGTAFYKSGRRSEFEATRVAPEAEGSSAEPAIDRTQYSIFGGSWRIEGDELVQSDTDATFSYLVFGDVNWTDYDYSVDVMRVAGRFSTALLFRNDSPRFYLYAVGHGSQALAEIHVTDRDENGQPQWWSVGEAEQPLTNHEWYTLRVSVRGSRHQCFIWNGFEMQTVFDFTDERFPRGRVGLRCVQSAFRFKNLQVTDPEGNVLWTGFPAVGGE